MVFPFSAEMLSEHALGTLKLPGVTVERTIHFCVRVQHYSAPGINHVTHNILISWQPKRVMPWMQCDLLLDIQHTPSRELEEHSESMSCRKPDMSQIWTAKQKAPSMQNHLQKWSLSTPSSVALLLDRLVI